MPSTVIAKMDYRPETETLRIIYTSGSIYDYLEVPEALFEEMKKAFSKGTFLNTKIKGTYDYKKIK